MTDKERELLVLLGKRVVKELFESAPYHAKDSHHLEKVKMREEAHDIDHLVFVIERESRDE